MVRKFLRALVLCFACVNAHAVGIPVPYQMFGPVDGQGTHRQVFPSYWEWMGGANTAKTKQMYFGLGYPPIRQAIFTVVWTCPIGAQAKLIYYWYDAAGLMQSVQLAVVQHEGSGYPRANGADVTQAMNELRNNVQHSTSGSQFGYVAFLVKGDGINECSVFEVRLMVVWQFD